MLRETQLHALQRHAFDYFLEETNTLNGLVADSSRQGSASSIASVGFALAAYPDTQHILAAIGRYPDRQGHR